MSYDIDEYDDIIEATNKLCAKVEGIPPYVQGKIVQGAMLMLEHGRMMFEEYGKCDATFTNILEYKGIKVVLRLSMRSFDVSLEVEDGPDRNHRISMEARGSRRRGAKARKQSAQA